MHVSKNSNVHTIFPSHIFKLNKLAAIMCYVCNCVYCTPRAHMRTLYTEIHMNCWNDVEKNDNNNNKINKG